MQIKELMTKQPVTCRPDSGLREVASQMADNDCGAIPVTENNRPVGMITDRDIACRMVAKGRNPLEHTAEDAMTSNVVTVQPTDSVEDVLQTMRNKQIRRVVVVGDDNEVVGIVAQADLARHVSEAEAGDTVREVSEPSSASAEPVSG